MTASRRPYLLFRWLPIDAIATIAVAVLVTMGQPAHAQQPEATSPVPMDRAAILARIASVGRRGFLYEVTRPMADGSAGKRLFLYGTIHVGRAGGEPFNAPVTRALAQSRRLALEADPSDTATAQRLALQLGQYDADDGLGRHVSPALLARITAFGATSGLPADRVERLRPWLLAIMVVAQQIGASGLAADLGSEFYLVGFAHGAQLPIVEIEGMEAQLRLFAGLSDALQEAELTEALGDADRDKVRDEGRALFDLWFDGDAAGAAAMVADLHRDTDGKVFERYFVDTLLDARNRTMADRAEQYLERAGNTFFAVGSLHLFGEAGLVREFERRGYRVVDLQAVPAAR